MIVTLEKQYTISLPAALVHSLHLRKGDKLHCVPGKQELRLVPLAQPAAAGAAQHILQIPPLPRPQRNPFWKYAVLEN